MQSKELLDATKLHEEMLQRPDPTISEQQRTLSELAHLDSIDAQLVEHWKDLHTSLISRTALLANIMGYQGFFATSILLDYAGHSPREAGLGSWVSKHLETLNKHHSTGEKSDKDIKLYQKTFASPKKEMMLDQDHVERRLRIAAAQPYPTGEIFRLIDECDWASLAAMLIDDRKLAVTLYSQKPLDPKSYNDNISKIVLRKMDEIKDKYFTDLSRASTYTTSKHAKDLSARKAAGLAHFHRTESTFRRRLGCGDRERRLQQGYQQPRAWGGHKSHIWALKCFSQGQHGIQQLNCSHRRITDIE
ncbi:hypothetical protein INS49_003570 [Diaporthe citri]|uniref:uncharacterized protein n=1 Tax=Diaporthe citri TaxID=83186 RepID=UPI001C80BA23|nr:uncharacterized protein INS49_003570 [Diaporthe citri]KAG6355608.1 hypothetical protein INS49_003570 [Diaporthe citri]